MMSVRGSRPKIASDRLTEPASLPSRVVIFISISRALLLGGGFRRRLRGGDRLADGDPAALRTRDRALDQDEATRHIGLHDFQIQRRDALDAHVAGHLLI